MATPNDILTLLKAINPPLTPPPPLSPLHPFLRIYTVVPSEELDYDVPGKRGIRSTFSLGHYLIIFWDVSPTKSHTVAYS